MPTEENPDREAQRELSELLEKRLGVEAQLTQARQGLSELESVLREREQTRMQAEQAVAGVQTRSEGLVSNSRRPLCGLSKSMRR